MYNAPINVLQLLGSVNRGGAEILVYDICKNYPKEIGMQHLFSYKGGDLENELRTSGIRYTKTTKGLLGLTLIFTLRKYIRDNNINVVHVHKTLDVFYAKLAVVGLKVKIIQTLHSLGSGFSYRLMRYFSGIIASNTLFVSGDLFNKYKKRYKTRANYSVLYNGLDYQKLRPKSSTFRKEMNLSENSTLAAMIGNFNYVRDHYTLCHTLRILIENNKNFHFAFVGGAQIRELYSQCYEFCKKNLILSNVHFLGVRKDIAEILSDIDLFVYSSRSDTFGIAVVEAMMVGVPVIVNDLSVFVEITENGKYATLYKTKDPEDMARQIEEFIKNPKPFHEKAQKAAIYAREMFSIEKHYSNLLEIYTTLLLS